MHRCVRESVLCVLLLATACSDNASTNGDAASTGTAGTSGGSAPTTAGQGVAGQGPASGTAGVAASGAAGRAAAGSGGTTAASGSGASGTGAGGAAAGSGGVTAAAAGMGAPAAGQGATAGGPAAGTGAPATGECDRMCLLAVMQSYLDALVAKDPTKVKTAAMFKYTENGVVSMLGDTIWKTVTGLVAGARLDFADPLMGQVASQLVVSEGSAPVIYQVRLKVVNHEITEIESMAVRRQGAANGFFNAEKMKPEPVFLQAIDPAKRMTRDAMLALTEKYLDYLEGKKSGGEVGFDMACKRYENGQSTASGLSSFELQSWSFDVTRRTLVVDEEAGITWGMYPFTQSATALVVGEAFKLIDGKIMMIQAVMANQPAKVWE
ncbi:MAG TPA: hypothetical protein VFG30_35895 [Polyangiales bacterium]|nr:hypothetical protein [Polyangiales bacterium]